MSTRTLLRFAPLCLTLLAGCLDHPLKAVEYDKVTVKETPFEVAVNKDVDILFVIDNSGSMAEEQALLSANFAAFIDVLEADDVKANYRIGITTTDSGNPRCPAAQYKPEGGALVLSSCIDRAAQNEFKFNDEDFSFACDDFCGKADADVRVKPTVTALDTEAKPRRWLESIEGQTNVEGFDSMVEAFQCYGPQGVAGCGFESHLESMYLSLAAASDKGSNNYGFIRDKAILSVVVISDETDCSFTPGAKEIFIDNKVFWSDPVNDPSPSSAVCWNAGVACDGSGPSYTDCHAENYDKEGKPGAADADAVLQPLSKYVGFLQSIEDQKKELEGEAQEVLVSMISGVPKGYETGKEKLVYEDSADPDFQASFGIGPGCVVPSGMPGVADQTAIPPVREREFAEAFEVNGERNLYSICQPDYRDALDAIAAKIRDQIKPACVPQCVRDTDPSTPVLDANCELEDVNASGEIRTPIPKCTEVKGEWVAPAGATACFGERIDADNSTPSKLDDMSKDCTDQGFNLEFFLVRSAAAPAGSSVAATCQLSANSRTDCPNL